MFIDEINQTKQPWLRNLDTDSKLSYSTSLRIDAVKLINIKTAKLLIRNILITEFPMDKSSFYDEVVTNE